MSARDRLLVAVVALAGLAAAGWFLVLAPRQDEAKTLSAQADAQRAALSTALNEIAAGEAARRRYPRDYATVARLGTAVPEDDNVASLLVQVERAAEASEVDFRSLRVASSSSAAPPPPPDPSAAATQVDVATLPPGAAVGSAGFPTMPFSFAFDGDFFRLSDFLGRLEHFLVVRNRALAVNGRFVTVDGFALNEGEGGFPRITATVAATTYLLPAAEGLTNGATPSGPAPTTPGADAGGQTASSSLPTPTATVTP